MTVLVILLFFLPLLGPLIAGLVGGRKSGNFTNAVLAAMLPSFCIALVLLAFASTVSSLPLVGAIASWGSLVVAFSGSAPMLIGAVLGGLLIPRHERGNTSKPAAAVVVLVSAILVWNIVEQARSTRSAFDAVTKAVSQPAGRQTPVAQGGQSQSLTGTLSRATKSASDRARDEAKRRAESAAAQASVALARARELAAAEMRRKSEKEQAEERELAQARQRAQRAFEEQQAAEAQRRARQAARMTIEGNGVLLDPRTGLRWTQSSVSNLTFPNAMSYCSHKPGGWRLPNAQELASLVDTESAEGAPCGGGRFADHCKVSAHFRLEWPCMWSTEQSPGKNWTVCLRQGNRFDYSVGNGFASALCVR
ncbi:MAG: DUF1566 domain-containing protein [Xanthomonadales bacterium]|nr:DUF1566 domain-containing protein [Xanthomonadales bacterium]